MAVKKVATKEKAEKAMKPVKTVKAKVEKAIKAEPVVKADKCECKCDDCKCNSNVWLLKSMFYTLISILVFSAITAVTTIIIAVDYHNNNKNTNSNYSTENNGNGTSTNNGNNDQEYDVSMFTEITAEELINLYNGEEKALIYIGRPTCGYCVAFLPALQQAQKYCGLD